MGGKPLRIATWNVNSVRRRIDLVCDWLQASDLDALCLQETKCVDDQFPAERFAELGYESHVHGQKAYNGVAILSRLPADDVARGMPGHSDPSCRMIAATVGGVRLVSAYVPNGNSVGSEKYHYKLDWLARFRDYLGGEMGSHPHVLAGGDYNIAPADIDVFDPVYWGEDILCSPPERAAYRELTKLGLDDVFRALNPKEQTFSWWDYRQNSFQRNRGLRIDLFLATHATVSRATECLIDSAPRGLEGPSDHAPVVVALNAG